MTQFTAKVNMYQKKKTVVEEKECGSREKRLAVIVVSIQAIQFPVDGSGFILSWETRTGEEGKGMEGKVERGARWEEGEKEGDEARMNMWEKKVEGNMGEERK